MFISITAIIVNLFNFMWLIGWPVWKQLRFVYYLKTREVEFMHSPDLTPPWDTSYQDGPFIICYIKVGPKEFYEWKVNNDGTMYNFGIWYPDGFWADRQRVIHTYRGATMNFLGQYPTQVKTISTRFFVSRLIRRYTQEQFIIAKMGGFKEYYLFKGS
jgi:hypothetical protein